METERISKLALFNRVKAALTGDFAEQSNTLTRQIWRVRNFSDLR